MLTLITGVPSAGKTLYALGLAEELRASGRTVYHNGINGLKLPWQILPDGEPWMTVPDGSVVVVDEAQKLWRVRPQGSQVPADVAALETHRHRGIDLIITTQAPTLIDSNVRKLVGRHFHLTRKYQRDKVGLYRWESCQSSPDTPTAQKQAVKTMWAHPPERFSWYESASIHTVKKEFPWMLVAKFGGGLLAVLSLVAATFYFLAKPARDAEANKPGEVLQSSGPPAEIGQRLVGPPSINPWSVEGRKPRLSEVPASAAYYDALFIKPASAPTVAGCGELVMDYKVKCNCWTDQGVTVDMSLTACRAWLRHGSHDHTKPRQDPNREVIARLNAANGHGPGASAEAVPAAVTTKP